MGIHVLSWDGILWGVGFVLSVKKVKNLKIKGCGAGFGFIRVWW